jgi:predicted MPP superfamily phosphohydrolase
MRPLVDLSRTRKPSSWTRRSFFFSGLAATAGLAVYANEPARHELEITRQTVLIRRLPPSFDGFRIAQISDLHLEEFTEDFFLRQVVQEVNALKPDLVLITGDFISRGPLPMSLSYNAAARCGEILSALECPERFGVLGNHDFFVGEKIVRDHMEANGLPLLVDESTRIERRGEYLHLVGLNDFWAGPDIAKGIPASPSAPMIVMMHEPDFANVIEAHPRGRFVDLILSGHTHGGQIRLPGLRPLSLPPEGKLYPEGLFSVGRAQLYVNRGIGTVGLPFRLNCRPEITELTLRPQPDFEQPDAQLPPA